MCADATTGRTSKNRGPALTCCAPTRFPGLWGYSDVPLDEPVALDDPVAPGACGVRAGAGAVELAIAAAFHSGIAFSSSAVLLIVKASLLLSHLKSSIGSATRWPPTPSRPP